jgi:coilin
MFWFRRKKLKVGKHVNDSKEDNVQQYQDQNGSRKLMLSAIDNETQKEKLEPETTATLMEQQKVERYYLKPDAR